MRDLRLQVTGEIPAPGLPRRIPSLDGLRAVSILLVIAGHASDSVNAPHFLTYFAHVGNLGVRFFFVISGFLITTLLLQEWEQTGTISMGGFYTRRALRIFPASFAYIGIIAICSALGWLALKPGDLAHAITYTMNYRYNPAHWFRHLWSLSVEEQFYLLWPGLLWFAGRRRSMKIAGGAVIAALIMRATMSHFFHASDSALTKHFEAVADSLAVGCLLSMNFNLLGTIPWYRRFQSSRLFWIAPGALVLGGHGLFLLSPASFYVLGQSITNLGIVLSIDWSIRHPNRGLGMVLNWRPVMYIGTLSYSLYLWQNAFLNPDWGAWPARLPQNVFIAFGMALASYYIVEKPFLRIKILMEPGGAFARRKHAPAYGSVHEIRNP